MTLEEFIRQPASENVYEEVCENVTQTEDFGRRLGQIVPNGTVIACVGGMGLGKTALAHGLAKGLGLHDDIASPTYAIVHEYTNGRLPLFHFDFYRLHSLEDLEQTGFDSYLSSDGILYIEWSEQLPGALPKPYLELHFQHLDENCRSLRLIWQM